MCTIHLYGERDRVTDRQRQADRQKDGRTGRQAGRQPDRQTDRPKDGGTEARRVPESGWKTLLIDSRRRPLPCSIIVLFC